MINMLLLVGGAIVNVAVACLFALRPWSKVQETAICYIRSTNPRTTVVVATGELYFGQFGGYVWRKAYLLNETPKSVSDAQFNSLLPHWSEFTQGDPVVTQSQDPERLSLWHYSETAFGWPAHSLFYTCCSRTPKDRSVTSIELPVSLTQLLARNSFRSEFPRSPIWPGFAINTIFYAAILWLLFFAPGAVRRTIRRKRGLCPACAYPIGTSPVCTECGNQLA